MKTSCKDAKKKGLALWYAQDFEKFIDFLRIVGPKTFPSATLDRKDYSKGYYPDNVRWANKETQGNNKGNVITVDYEGETRTLTEWSNLLGIPRSVLVYRHSQGWTDEEIIEGKKDAPKVPDVILELPWPDGKQAQWEATYIAHCKGKEPREKFMVRRTKEKLAGLEAQAKSHYEAYGVPEDDYEDAAPPLLVKGPGGVVVPWQDEYDRWKALHNHALAQLLPKERRKAFIYREGGLGSTKEKAIYDWLISQVGEVSFDPGKFKPQDGSDYGD